MRSSERVKGSLRSTNIRPANGSSRLLNPLTMSQSSLKIPATLNITLSIASYGLAIFFLWLTAHAGPVWVKIAGAIGFSLIANTIFSLMHESVHGIFHTHHRINYGFGLLSSAFFPTSFTFQKVCHLGHHRRNRSDVELFDYYYDERDKWIKRLQLYWILLGIYWLAIPFGCLVYLVWPRAFQWGLFRNANRSAQVTSTDAMLSGFDDAPVTRIRLEILFALAFQVILFLSLNLTWWSWLLCYGAFALNWCSLQYTDHAFSERDVKNGAWNLKVNKFLRYIFLNYHFHLAHHQDPSIPWIHLPRFVKPDQPRPSFLKLYLQLWKGPRLTTEPPPAKNVPVE